MSGLARGNGPNQMWAARVFNLDREFRVSGEMHQHAWFGWGVERLQRRNGILRESFHVFVVPSDDAVQAIEQMFFLAEAVRLTRIDDQIGWDAVTLQPSIKLLALSERINRVGVTLQNERRRLGVFQEQ